MPINPSQISGFINPALDAGLKLLSSDAQLTFQKYSRVALPADGYVFWVRQEGETAVVRPASIHVSREPMASEGYQWVNNKYYLTTDGDLGGVALGDLNSLWMAQAPDGDLWVLEGLAKRYDEAGLWHAEGHSVRPDMRSQIISDASELPKAAANTSLPIWMALREFDNGTMPWGYFPAGLEVLPARMAIPAPSGQWIAVETLEARNVSLGRAGPPADDGRTPHGHQDVFERVRLRLYGFDADQAEGFCAFLDNVRSYWGVPLSTSGATVLQDAPGEYDESGGDAGMMASSREKVIELDVNYDRRFAYQACSMLMNRVIVQLSGNDGLDISK